mgnify:CR=1 FL=1
MPKFKRSCNNPFHEEWAKKNGGAIVNLAGRGLLSLSRLFESFIEAELGKKIPRGVKYLCTTCLRECFKKRKFTKCLPKDSSELERKVQRQVWKIVIDKNHFVKMIPNLQRKIIIYAKYKTTILFSFLIIF